MQYFLSKMLSNISQQMAGSSVLIIFSEYILKDNDSEGVHSPQNISKSATA